MARTAKRGIMPIKNPDLAATVIDQRGFLEYARCHCHAGTAGPEHMREHFVS